MLGTACALVSVSCSKLPFEMVDVNNMWDDNYSGLADDSTYWSSCGTYNVSDPSCRLIDDTFYIFSSDVIYKDPQTQSWGNNRRGGNNQGGNRMGPGGGGFPGGGFPGMPGFPGMGQSANRSQKSKDRVALARQERMKLRAAAMGLDTTTVVADSADMPQDMPMDPAAMFAGGMPNMSGGMPGMAGGMPGMMGGMPEGMPAMGGMPNGVANRQGAMPGRGDANGAAVQRGGSGSSQRQGQTGQQQGNQQRGGDQQRGGQQRSGNQQRGGAPQGGFPDFSGGGFPDFSAFAGFGDFARGRGMRGMTSGKVGDGFIQRRKSTDLVNWEFAGWVFDSLPASASEWTKELKGRAINTTKAPFVMEYNGKVRLYYTLASPMSFGPAFIGLAEGESVYGPWEDKGCVIKSDMGAKAVATDPTIIERDGKMYMYYGAGSTGIYCVELNAATGLLQNSDDYGVCLVKRAEAAEVVYNDEFDQYYMFCSFGRSMGNYNIRVGRSNSPMGPFVDFNGKALSNESLPEVVTPYSFDKHEGWIGTGHASVFCNDDDEWFIAHNGRLKSDARIMDLHVRQIVFNEDGWPMVAPERYTAYEEHTFTAEEVCGGYEILRFRGNDSIPCKYINIELVEDDWSFDKGNQKLNLTLWNGEQLSDLKVFVGHDWERQSTTVQFVGIEPDGHTVWGKRVD